MREPKERTCPGCNELRQFWPRKGVCFECQKYIEKGRRAEKEQQNRGKQLYRLSQPYLGETSPGFSSGDPDVPRALSSLIDAVSEKPLDFSYPSPSLPYLNVTPMCRPGSSIHDGGWVLLFEPRVAEALEVLCKEIVRELDATYRRGKEDGRNILQGLMDGSLSTVEADEEERSGRQGGLDRKEGD